MMAALTFSRSAFVGLSFILGYYLLSRRRIGSFLLTFLIILGASLLLPNNPLVERATTGFGRETRMPLLLVVSNISGAHCLPTSWEAPSLWSWLLEKFDVAGHSESARRDAAGRTPP